MTNGNNWLSQPDDPLWKDINDAVLKEVCKVRVAQMVFPSTVLPNDPTEVINDVVDFPSGIGTKADDTTPNRATRIRPIELALAIPEGLTKPFQEIYCGFALTGAQVSKEGETRTARTLARMAAKEIALAEDIVIFQGKDGAVPIDVVLEPGFSGEPDVYTDADKGLLRTTETEIDVKPLPDSPNAVSEVQKVTLPPATAGAFKLKFREQETGDLNHNASQGDVQTALTNLATIGTGNVGVTRAGAGTSAAPFVYTVTFQGALAGRNVPEITATSNLTGPSGFDPKIKIETITEGVPVYGPNTFKAVVDGIAYLTKAAQAPKHALILPSAVYADTYAPVGDTLVTTADRIKPLVEGGFLGTGTLPDPTDGTPGYGLLAALGGDPTSVYVGREAKAQFLQQETSKYLFRVVERVQFVARDKRALVRLKFE